MVLTTRSEVLAKPTVAAITVMMVCVSTAIVVAVVAGLMLLGIGMVANQLIRLRRYLREAPPGEGAREHPQEAPDNPTP
ncbi:hypothetical protein [Mycobacterium parmense]|uniref:hypothetical protein n=1 Tax=Mycobacterium parmense TaxID=185642 RepID=UPI00111C2344|nr:hypothetical protein [Mycobacterium parmense]MCV7352905.1 hypothetical protein [Mycobacterium parmense]